MGNGAREAIDRYFAEETELPPERPDRKFMQADHLLAWLWQAGFKVVPVIARDVGRE